MNKNNSIIAIICTVVILLNSTSASYSNQELTYENMAKAVFDRVFAAADKKTNCLPYLECVSNDTIWIHSENDGKIVITSKVLKFCYQGVTKETGDARLAFLIGHEMSHLFNNDFKYDTPMYDKISSNTRKFLIKAHEIKADEDGLLNTTMAGYNLWSLVKKDNNFFQDWIDEAKSKKSNHPFPSERKNRIIKKINELKEDMIYFRIGVRLFQIERYEEALEFLKKFKEKFQCREVFNNIGLIYYQMAMEKLYAKNKKSLYRFKLSTFFDPHTRAELLDDHKERYKGDKIKLDKEIKELFEKAIKNFEIACSKDPFYAPSRINLSSLYIIKEEYNKSINYLDEALKINPKDPHAMNNKAVAEYLKNENSPNGDSFLKAKNELESIIKNQLDFSDAYYNLGRLFYENKNIKEAKANWNKFGKLEPESNYYSKLNKQFVLPNSKKKAKPTLKPLSSVMPGPFNNKVADKIDAKQHIVVDLEDTYQVLSNVDIKVLVKRYDIILVESSLNKNEKIYSFDSCNRKFKSLSGISTYVFDKFALDVKKGKVINEIYY